MRQMRHPKPRTRQSHGNGRAIGTLKKLPAPKRTYPAWYHRILWKPPSPGILTIFMPIRDGRCSDSHSDRNWKGRPPKSVAGFFIALTMNLDFAKSGGLVTAVIQDHSSGRVLMVGYMNEEAFRRTVASGYATFYSRSRQKLWLKGESSGHRLVVKEIATDCDRDAVLVKVQALGPGVCHEGYQSCFFRKLEDGEWRVADQRTFDPAQVYGSKVYGGKP
jgi:phosphoribosyl-AMP cyclohydrolase